MKKKNFFKKIIFSQFFLTILGLSIIFFIGMPLVRNIIQQKIVNKEIEELKKEIIQAEENKSNIKKVIQYLETDEFVEERARLSMGFKNPGEEVVIINNNVLQKNRAEEVNSGNINKETVESLKDRSNQEKWWFYFFEK